MVLVWGCRWRAPLCGVPQGTGHEAQGLEVPSAWVVMGVNTEDSESHGPPVCPHLPCPSPPVVAAVPQACGNGCDHPQIYFCSKGLSCTPA